MDAKDSLIAGLLVAILLGGGFLTLTINSDEKEEKNDSEDETSNQNDTESQIDTIPQILISSNSKNWDGQNITISGFPPAGG